MNNLDFLKAVLMSDAKYWIVAKRNEYLNSRSEPDSEPDSIILISFPYTIKTGMKYEDIKLSDIEGLSRVSLDMNIFINKPYAPFQRYTSLYDIYKGYPVKKNIKQFMIDALALNSDSIYDYKELLEKEDTEKL